MNWEQIEGKWKETKGSVREQWGKLTDQDLEVIAGKKDRLLGKLQQAYGMGKEKASENVDQWLAGYGKASEASSKTIKESVPMEKNVKKLANR
jgi:uncharacterized protein YjbJ (UPF0337 family)